MSTQYESARARKMHIEAELAEIELSKARKEYVAVDDILATWSDIFGNVKAKLLSMPSALAPIVKNQNTTAEIKEVIAKEINQALAELAAYDPKTDITQNRKNRDQEDGEDGLGRSGTAAVTKRRPVGRPRKASKL